MPSAPLPEKRSSTLDQSPLMPSSMEKMAPRTKSVAGRVPVPLGTLRWCPLALPAITRIILYMILGYGEKVNSRCLVTLSFP
jgi:hypothetical protein